LAQRRPYGHCAAHFERGDRPAHRAINRLYQ
jgi:hypothetical protein